VASKSCGGLEGTIILVIYTLVRVAISLVGIGTGLMVLAGMLVLVVQLFLRFRP
jgi:hypothetical protein